VSFLVSLCMRYNEGAMKINAQKIVVGSFFIVLCCIATVFYRNAHSPYGNWIYSAQKPDGGQIIIRMLLFRDAPGTLLLSDWMSFQIRASNHLRRSKLLHLRCTSDKNRLDMYEINAVGAKKDRLFAVASVSGFNQLEVRFLRPQHTGFPSRAFFKRKKWPDA